MKEFVGRRLVRAHSPGDSSVPGTLTSLQETNKVAGNKKGSGKLIKHKILNTYKSRGLGMEQRGKHNEILTE